MSPTLPVRFTLTHLFFFLYASSHPSNSVCPSFRLSCRPSARNFDSPPKIALIDWLEVGKYCVCIMIYIWRICPPRLVLLPFRFEMLQRISIRGHVPPSVRPSIALLFKTAWFLDIKIPTFLQAYEWEKRASEQMSAAERASKASSAKQMNEWAVPENE